MGKRVKGVKGPPDKPIDKMTVKELEQAVRYHNALYFEKNAPVISDYEFDRLTRRLGELKPDSTTLSEISTEGEERPKIAHLEPMLSLEKAYTEEEVQKWAAKFEGPLLVSPKIDGLAVEIRYDAKGELSLAATRGDGFRGDIITENIRMIEDVPIKLPQGDVEIRGEVYMRLSIFKRRYQGQFANPRNLAAGAVKQKDPRKTQEYGLSFFAYGLRGTNDRSTSDRIGRLKRWNIPVVEIKKIERAAIGKTFKYFIDQRDAYDYETDGVVYQTDLIDEQERLGSTAHHPRWSIAYKYQGDSGVTTLQDVEWSVARSRVITPIGIVRPVELSGAQVSRVSLHNYGLMQEKKLRNGAEVVMVRRGGVIPYLESVKKAGKGKPFTAPKKCPSCGAATEVRDEFLYCTNKKSCTRTKIAELEHFIKTAEIDGFGPKLILRLYESNFVSEPADFYDLTKETLLELERMGEKLATKLIRNVQDKRTLPLNIFIASLGIREVGPQVAKLLATHLGSFETLRKAGEEELTGVETVGPVVAQELMQGLVQKRASIDRLLKHVTVRKVATVPKGKLAGKKFCFTGQMAAMSRTEGQKKVEALGATAVNSVTKDLDYLVVGSEGGAGSKLNKAKKLVETGASVNIINEGDFLKLIGKSVNR